MIPVTIPEQLRAIALLDAAKRDSILCTAKKTPRDPVMPPSPIPLWSGHRRYLSAIGKLDQLTPEARAALDQVPDPWRIALLLQLQGRTQDEIAAELSISKMQLNSYQKSAKRVIQRTLWSGKTRYSWSHTRPNAVRFTPAELEGLGRLRQPQRTVLALWLDGRTVPEIAARLRQSETSVRSTLEKARKRLKVLASHSQRSRATIFAGSRIKGLGSSVSEEERKAIDLLPPRQRTALLRQLDGNRISDISAEMGTSVPAVKELLKNGKRNVLAIMANRGIRPLKPRHKVVHDQPHSEQTKRKLQETTLAYYARKHAVAGKLLAKPDESIQEILGQHLVSQL